VTAAQNGPWRVRDGGGAIPRGDEGPGTNAGHSISRDFSQNGYIRRGPALLEPWGGFLTVIIHVFPADAEYINWFGPACPAAEREG